MFLIKCVFYKVCFFYIEKYVFFRNVAVFCSNTHHTTHMLRTARVTRIQKQPQTIWPFFLWPFFVAVFGFCGCFWILWLFLDFVAVFIRAITDPVNTIGAIAHLSDTLGHATSRSCGGTWFRKNRSLAAAPLSWLTPAHASTL